MKLTLSCPFLLIIVFFLTPAVYSAGVPEPLRLFVPFEAAWNGMNDTLELNDWGTAKQDRGQGLILTNFREYASGPLTENHIAKIGVKQKLTDAYWNKVEFQYEVTIELIEEKETLVTVDCNIRALKRDYFGNESWVDIVSSGEKERELLTRFGKSLFGEKFELEHSRTGFWESVPTNTIEMMKDTPSTLPGPERP